MCRWGLVNHSMWKDLERSQLTPASQLESSSVRTNFEKDLLGSSSGLLKFSDSPLVSVAEPEVLKKLENSPHSPTQVSDNRSFFS